MVFHNPGIHMPITSPRIVELTNALHVHPLYRAADNRQALARFAEHHVFAVWDFMSLLKSLQASLTCVRVPWTPPASGRAARLVNEIVLGEESDLLHDGSCGSHFSLYLMAMRELGADVEPISTFTREVSAGVPLARALQRADAPEAVRPFVMRTFEVIETRRPHAIAAAFALGREDLVPWMFQRVAAAAAMMRDDHPAFFHYLERHIELDLTSHGPLAAEVLSELCGSDPAKVGEAVSAAEGALAARLELWDGLFETLISEGCAYAG